MGNTKEIMQKELNALWMALRQKYRHRHAVQIVPYRTYGTTNRLLVRGRVLADKGIKTSVGDTLLTNLANMYKRFESDELPNALVSVKHQDIEHQVFTDNEGYFELNFAPDQAIALESLWHPVTLNLPQTADPVMALAEVMIPPLDAEYGVISDIDDTVVKTSATNLLKMAKIVLLNNAHTRLPFAGVSAFYQSLQWGRNGKANNPFFYVSSSPWNLYDLLKDFLDLNRIPEGPLLLRDFGFKGLRFSGSGGHLGHKMKAIEAILLTYPSLNFILIGDSGQEDPLIYREVVKRHPGRILAIYIRNVNLPAREKLARRIAKELSDLGLDMLVTAHASQAAEHAMKRGFIDKATYDEFVSKS